MKKIITCLLVTLSITCFSQNYDSISFETPNSKIIIDAASNNTWQIGTPGKIFFESAHSETKAILTDSIISIKFDDEQMVFHQLTVYDISG